MADVTIGEVRIDVDLGNEVGEATFARLFRLYMRRWTEQQALAEREHRTAESERVLFDRNRRC